MSTWWDRSVARYVGLLCERYTIDELAAMPFAKIVDAAVEVIEAHPSSLFECSDDIHEMADLMANHVA